MIEFERINVHYGKNHVLKDVSLSVRAGEIVALIGANAAGKTTALRTALGLKALTSGAVRFDGTDLTHAATPERVHRGLVLVPEGRQVLVKFTVAENLLMGGYHRSDRDRMQEDLDRIYGQFPVLSDRRKQRAGSMSGGEQQMLAIARGSGDHRNSAPSRRQRHNGPARRAERRDGAGLRRQGLRARLGEGRSRGGGGRTGAKRDREEALPRRVASVAGISFSAAILLTILPTSLWDFVRRRSQKIHLLRGSLSNDPLQSSHDLGGNLGLLSRRLSCMPQEGRDVPIGTAARI